MLNSLRHLRVSGIAAALFLAISAPAKAVDGQEIMQKVYDQSRIHANQSASVEMRIYDAAEDERKRWFKSQFRVFKDRSKSLIRIFKPTTQKGIGLLSESLDSKARSDQWMYLPAFRSTRKINSESRNNSFLGSDLSVGDMAGRKPQEDTHELLSEDGTYWTVQSVPVADDEPYSRFVSKVHKKVLVATEVVFYDLAGKKLKTMRNLRIGRFDGMYMATEVLVTNHQSGGRTELTRSDIDIKSKIGKNEVGLRGLSNPR